jgi:hypothetical protein
MVAVNLWLNYYNNADPFAEASEAASKHMNRTFGLASIESRARNLVWLLVVVGLSGFV